MRDFSDSTHVADIVAHHPSTSVVFEKHKIDFCCGGAISLQDACQDHHLETVQVLQELHEVLAVAPPKDRDWADEENIDMIVEYILKKYHDPLRMDLVGIQGTLTRVVEVHGERHGELKDIEQIFRGLAEELKQHMMKEETILFPLMKSIYAAWKEKSSPSSPPPPHHHCGSVQNPIRQMELEHQEAGKSLISLRELSHDFQVPTNGCNSYKALMRGLEKVEKDLHHHIHLENYVLHPLATRMEQELYHPSS